MAERPSPYPEKLAELEDLLDLIEDRNQRIDLLIETADRFREVPSEVAERPYPDDHKVPACESEAFVWAKRRDDGTLQLYFAVENPQGISAKAMAVILDDALSGAPLEAVANVQDDVVYRVFGSELSMGKTMGLMGMTAMARISAQRLLARER
jgi:cysteine desulfuration protein SufE